MLNPFLGFNRSTNKCLLPQSTAAITLAEPNLLFYEAYNQDKFTQVDGNKECAMERTVVDLNTIGENDDDKDESEF